MVLCALSPVIFYLVKRWGIWWIALVSMLFVIGMHFPIGISVTGILFFSIGCMWSIKSLQICHLNCKKTIIILVALFVLSNFFEIEFLHQLFILGLAMLLIKLFGAVKSGWVEYVAQYTDSIFFVLAVHNIFILANVGKLLNRVFTGISSWIIYWIAPFVTLTICIILHRTLKKIAPNLMNILCGGR